MNGVLRANIRELLNSDPTTLPPQLRDLRERLLEQQASGMDIQTFLASLDGDDQFVSYVERYFFQRRLARTRGVPS